jgi:hypothetical protein
MSGGADLVAPAVERAPGALPGRRACRPLNAISGVDMALWDS